MTATNGETANRDTIKRETWQKRAVQQALNSARGFVSAQELHQQLATGDRKVGLTTVYRALTDLVEVGEADALPTAEGELKYRACATGHHHHISCRNCGKAVEFELEGLEQAVRELAEKHRFSSTEHSLEIFGLCSRCS
jgi:Fur family transcriptional regulator, ferric uptake regulator